MSANTQSFRNGKEQYDSDVNSLSGFSGYEVGPIRPPSEAKSLLVRVTRNCQWNRCVFCPVYKNKEHSIRPVDDVISDIDLLSKYVSMLREAFNSPDDLSRGRVWSLMKEVNPTELNVFDFALKWFSDGMHSVFLQDADSLAAGSENLAMIIAHLRHRFPLIQRVTSYARTSTILKVGEQGLIRLKEAGLDRIHVGLESGSDDVLKLVKKGATQDMHIRAGVMIKNTGFELSEYVMPGLGGKRYSDVHARETAKALNQIDADFIRLRPLAITSRAPLLLEMSRNDFQKLNDIQMAEELEILFTELDGISSMILSDHILNLFEDLEGRLPHDKERLLSIVKGFLQMDPKNQMLYRLGRRLGFFRGLDDMMNQHLMDRVHQIAVDQGISEFNIDRIIDSLMERFI